MSVRQQLWVSGRYMAINCPVVCLQYIYYPMTDGQIILRNIELPPPHSVAVPNFLYAPTVHSILHYNNILLFHISFVFSGSGGYQDGALCCVHNYG